MGDDYSNPAPIILDEKGFTVVGVACRTSNAREMTSDGLIGKQWERFQQENMLGRITKRLNDNVLAVYTDYASDKDGEYTFLIGAKVSSAEQLPAGMVTKQVPAGRYAVFISERGAAARVVPATWMRIWRLPRSAPGGDRAYHADYELYDQRAADPQNAQVEIHVGIK
ncbi:MAG TPA: GyrI-like domain-containing protein [Terriglobales bacterium]|nr:GyrI-like domain-containing protein [Terriglobales bacterium]